MAERHFDYLDFDPGYNEKEKRKNLEVILDYSRIEILIPGEVEKAAGKYHTIVTIIMMSGRKIHRTWSEDTLEEAEFCRDDAVDAIWQKILIGGRKCD